MGRVLIIGAGGVGRVVAHKCCQAPQVFSEICLASRTREKCDRIAQSLPRQVRTAAVDADKPAEVAALIRDFGPEMVIHVALPYQDLSIMEACLQTGVHYLDTANYEKPEEARFSYTFQWPYDERFRKAGLMAVLGCGFDPGVTNIFCAHALKNHFDQIDTIDILDCNAGDHGLPFATNFNPEINIREVTAKGRYWQDGGWIETEPMAVHKSYNFPGVGEKEIYLLYHEEMESLAKHIPGIKRMRFWMTFSQRYLTHLEVLQNVGMTRIDPVDFEGRQIVPLKFLKALLPDPASLGPRTKGKTNIGCVIVGRKNGQERRYYVYNICDHQEAFRETGAQAISYTTGVPAALGAMLMMTRRWQGAGVFNVEQLDPSPFMDALGPWGLPWQEMFSPVIP
jgi:saccharopine dehydrogenase (NAD+, L-lysine forming)